MTAAPHIETDRHGVQRKSQAVFSLFFKSAAIFSASGICLWVSFRRRETLMMQALLAAFGIMVTLPFIRTAFDHCSLAIETRRRNRAERKSWKMCERRIYKTGRLLVTAGNDEVDDGIVPRRVCVVEHNADKVDKPTILFVHGSMAQLTQFDKQINEFTKVWCISSGAACMLSCRSSTNCDLALRVVFSSVITLSHTTISAAVCHAIQCF